MANLCAEFGDYPAAAPPSGPNFGVPRLAWNLGWPVAAPVYTAPVLIAGDETGSGLKDAQSKGANPDKLSRAEVPGRCCGKSTGPKPASFPASRPR